MLNNLSKLIERAKNIDSLCMNCAVPGVNNNIINNIEKKLNIIIPFDMKIICNSIDYVIISPFDLYDFSDNEDGFDNIVKNNKALRQEYMVQSKNASNMSHILVLADDDGGSIFMITQDSPDKPTPVIWCDYGDMYYYSIHKKFQYPHDEWRSFTDFFEYSLKKKEEN